MIESFFDELDKIAESKPSRIRAAGAALVGAGTGAVAGGALGGAGGVAMGSRNNPMGVLGAFGHAAKGARYGAGLGAVIGAIRAYKRSMKDQQDKSRLDRIAEQLAELQMRVEQRSR